MINSPQYMQIFTNNLNEEYGVIDDSWLTISAEGFGEYGELVKLYREEDEELAFEAQADNEYYFQSTAATDRRLTDSLGFHLNAYDLELPEYIEGEINLYAGKGTYPYGEVYESDIEFNMSWDSTGFNDYTVNTNTFNVHDYNSDNFLLSILPLTGGNTFIEGELYLHHRIDLLEPSNIITTGLPTNVEFAVILPNATSRIPSLSVKNIDQIGTPWDWVESWQGFALTESDYQLYNPDLATTYNPSVPLTEGTHYDVVVNSEGRDQINFYLPKGDIKQLILNNDFIQIDFHIDYEFSQSDYAIEENSNTYNSEIHWQLPDSSYLDWNQFEYHPDLTSTAIFYISYSHLSDYAPPDDFKTTLSETFTFYPREYNFTEITFTGFDDDEYEVTLNLTYGGDFQNRWDDVKPFGMTIQTSSGERYLSDDYMRNWQQDSQYSGKQIFTFSMFKDFFEPLNILNDTQILITYYYQKESLSYYAKYDDILYGSDFTFTIRDSLGTIIKNLGNVSSIVGNNITFTDSIEEYLTIGKNFTIEYTFKTRGGLLESKHLFISRVSSSVNALKLLIVTMLVPIS